LILAKLYIFKRFEVMFRWMSSVTLIMRFPAAQRIVGRDPLVGGFYASGVSPV